MVRGAYDIKKPKFVKGKHKECQTNKDMKMELFNTKDRF